MSKWFSTAQAPTKRAADFWCAAFSCKFSQNMHLLRCPSAFRLRRLAQNARLIKWDLVQALVRSSCGDPDKVLPERSLHDLVQVLWDSCGDPGGLLSERSLHDLHSSMCEDLAENPPMYRSFWEDLVILLKSSKRSLHDLVQVPVRISCGDPGEILSCVILYRTLWVKSCGCPCVTCTGPFGKILWRSCPNPPWKEALR